jgi:hypothetical protein
VWPAVLPGRSFQGALRTFHIGSGRSHIDEEVGQSNRLAVVAYRSDRPGGGADQGSGSMRTVEDSGRYD